MEKQHSYSSLSEVHHSVDPSLKPKGWRRVLSFFGPAYLISVGYMDPGNWATDLAGGSKFGYKLLWVLLMSNMIALLLQSMSARLGIVRGRDLAQANREIYPRAINFVYYFLAEIAIAATDLAEILGMAIGFQLLTGLPLIWGVLLTIADTFLFLFLQKLGIRKMEAFIICLISVIGCSFLVEIMLAKPNMGEVVKGFYPSIPNEQALYIAIGIIGATVMPHNLYLHSALVQTRKIKRDNLGIKRALRLTFFDSAIALNIAFFVNAFILILAATVFFKTGRTEVGQIKQAHELLSPLLGSVWAPRLFAIALIASGQSSTITGTLAGQIIMEGYLHLRITPWVRRLLTRLIAVVPAVLVIILSGESNVDNLLILSQVVLSIQLGFAIIPLIHLTSNKKTMGAFAIKPLTIVAASFITALLVYLNLRMVVEQSVDLFNSIESIIPKILIVIAGIMYVVLLFVAIFYPFKKKEGIISEASEVHPEAIQMSTLSVPQYKTIVVALDFSINDYKLISHALGQGIETSNYVLIHVVESAATRIIGNESDDLETRKDQIRLNEYVEDLKLKGFRAIGLLGFDNRVKEIVRLANENNADILVIGAHGHSGLKDVILGHTVEDVRHELRIPILVINI